MLLRDAFEAKDWEALGYGTFEDYRVREFGRSLIKFANVGQRRESVKTLAEARDEDGYGLTNGQIAQTLGVSEGSVRNDVRKITNLARPTHARTAGGVQPISKPRVSSEDVTRVREAQREDSEHFTLTVTSASMVEDTASLVDYLGRVTRTLIKNPDWADEVQITNLRNTLDNLEDARHTVLAAINQLTGE